MCLCLMDIVIKVFIIAKVSSEFTMFSPWQNVQQDIVQWITQALQCNHLFSSLSSLENEEIKQHRTKIKISAASENNSTRSV